MKLGKVKSAFHVENNRLVAALEQKEGLLRLLRIKMPMATFFILSDSNHAWWHMTQAFMELKMPASALIKEQSQ